MKYNSGNFPASMGLSLCCYRNLKNILSLFLFILIFFQSVTHTFGQYFPGSVETKNGDFIEGKVLLRWNQVKLKEFQSNKKAKWDAGEIASVNLIFDGEEFRFHHVKTALFGQDWLMFYKDIGGKKIYRHVRISRSGKYSLKYKWYYFGQLPGEDQAICLFISEEQPIAFVENLRHFFGEIPGINDNSLEDWLASGEILYLLDLYETWWHAVLFNTP